MKPKRYAEFAEGRQARGERRAQFTAADAPTKIGSEYTRDAASQQPRGVIRPVAAAFLFADR
jgi:hypothetical protein